MRPHYEKLRKGYLVKHANRDEVAFLPPVSYSIAMNLDRFDYDSPNGNDENYDGCVWRPNCPAGFVALGTVFTKFCTKPALGDIYCVKHAYATLVDSWELKYKNRWYSNIKPGAIALLKAKPDMELQRDLLTFGATQNSGKYKIIDNPMPFYALTRSATRYQAEKPVVKAKMGDVIFDFSNMNKKVENVKMNPITISNYHNLPQKVHRTLTYEDIKETSFTGSWKMAYGTTVQVVVKIPVVNMKLDFKTTVSSSWEGIDGEVNKNTTTESIKATVDVPANSKMTATIIANKYTSDIPYTAVMTKYFYDGSTTSYPVEGMFKGVTIDEVQIQYSETQELLANLRDRKRRSVEDSADPRCWKVFDTIMLKNYGNTALFAGSADNCRQECTANYPRCTGFLFDNFARNGLHDCWLTVMNKWKTYKESFGFETHVMCYENQPAYEHLEPKIECDGAFEYSLEDQECIPIICDDGFEVVGNVCKSINDCYDGPCPSGARCIDGHKTYTCECPKGLDIFIIEA